MTNYGIIGAGISGLTMAYKISKQMLNNGKEVFIKVFQTENFAGGRALTKIIKDQNMKNYHLDIGANLIDFQNQESLKYWNQLIPEKIRQNLRLFEKPFLIFQDNKFRKGDYQKNRYYYKGGFIKLVDQFAQEINKKGVNILYNHQVKKIQVNQVKVSLDVYNKTQNKLNTFQFDKVFMSCPSPHSLNILQNSFKQNSLNQEIASLINYSKLVKYTKQLSVGFQTSNANHFFSSILFKNHPILSFICSHQQKYGEDSFVAQIGEQFSEKYFNQDFNVIAQLVYQSLPQQIKIFTNIKPIIIHRWPVSLIKSSPKQKINSQFKRIQIIGDSIIGKSRVSGAVHSTIYSKL